MYSVVTKENMTVLTDQLILLFFGSGPLEICPASLLIPAAVACCCCDPGAAAFASAFSDLTSLLPSCFSSFGSSLGAAWPAALGAPAAAAGGVSLGGNFLVMRSRIMLTLRRWKRELGSPRTLLSRSFALLFLL